MGPPPQGPPMCSGVSKPRDPKGYESSDPRNWAGAAGARGAAAAAAVAPTDNLLSAPPAHANPEA
eukprot:4171965-Lingulodinium_polyedra.AAC.1